MKLVSLKNLFTPLVSSIPLVLGAIGFGSAGVAAGSYAASIQTANTAAGSLFAICQSIGATGTLAGSTYAAGAGAGGLVGGWLGRKKSKRNDDDDDEDDDKSDEKDSRKSKKK